MGALSIAQARRVLEERGWKATVRPDSYYALTREGQPVRVVSGEQLVQEAAALAAEAVSPEVAKALEVFADQRKRTVTPQGNGMYLSTKADGSDPQYWAEDKLLEVAANMSRPVEPLFKGGQAAKAPDKGGQAKPERKLQVVPPAPAPPADPPAPPPAQPAPQAETPQSPQPGAPVHLEGVDPRVMQLTAEINAFQDQEANATWQIGRRLNEVKEIIGHNNWLLYLKTQVHIPEDKAQRYMRIARELDAIPNTAPVRFLPTTSLYLLIQQLGAEGAVDFASQPQLVPSKGEEVPVNEMSKRELQEALAAKKQAEQRAADAGEEARQAREAADHALTAGEQLKARIKELESQPAPEPQTVETPVADPALLATIERLRNELGAAQARIGELQNKAALSESETAELKKLLAKAEKSKNSLEETVTRYEGNSDGTRLADAITYINSFRLQLLQAMGPLKTLLHPGLGEQLEAAGLRDVAEALLQVGHNIQNCLPQR